MDKADKAAVLIDAAAYFAHLESALRQARHSILILGWDFDAEIRLRPEEPESESPPLGTLLRSLVEAKPGLSVDVLVWSTSILHAPGASGPALFGAAWQDHPRIRVKLDTNHPIYAAHHQKLVSIDDKLAFVGGIDLTVRRWDTTEHRKQDPRRRVSSGDSYGPVHDVQMAVEGDVAGSLAELARERWKAGTIEPAPAAAPPVAASPWPKGLLPDFRDTDVAISRTVPRYMKQAEVREAALLTEDALSAARNSIYIETQYLTARYVGDVLARQLARPDGPEIVIVMPHHARGAIERFAMGTNAERLIHRLRLADRYRRLRVYQPYVGDDGDETYVLIHSKVLVVDDRFLRIGSSNLNNRSIALDTECDLALEAKDEAACKAVAGVREALLAEHLGVQPEMLRQAVEKRRSLIGAIDEFNHSPRGLEISEAQLKGGARGALFGTQLLDPKRPYTSPWFRRTFEAVMRRLHGGGVAKPDESANEDGEDGSGRGGRGGTESKQRVD